MNCVARLCYHTCSEKSREIGNLILFSLLLVCYTKRNGHPGRGVPTAETDTPGGGLRQKRTPREGCPYDRNGHPGRGVPTTETDTPGGVPYGRNGHPGRGVPTTETDTPGGVSLRGRDSVELPKRNPNRIRGFDYSQNGAYFVTICTQNRQRILSKIVGTPVPGCPQAPRPAAPLPLRLGNQHGVHLGKGHGKYFFVGHSSFTQLF